MEINVLVDDAFKEHVEAGWLQSVAGQALSAENVSPQAEISLVITGQEQIQELNRSYRGRDEPTDVLAFSMLEKKDDAPFIAPPDGILHLGEVIISYPQAIIQAEENRHPVEKELALLIVHGVLHLLGYEHDTPEAEQKMRAREAAIIKKIDEGPA